MMKRISLLLALCATTGMSWAADSPFVGAWKLDPSRTKLTDQMKVVNVSGNKYAFDFGGGAETITVDGTDQAGVGDTMLSVTPQAPDSWKVVRKKDGRVLLTAMWKLSQDGNSLADDFTLMTTDGSASTINYVYKRTAGTSGFAGTWESTSAATNDFVFVLDIRPFEKAGLSFVNSSQGRTKSVNFDGKEYPVVGTNVIAGLVTSARVIDEHTLELTDKFKGRIVDTQEVRLSPDRKMLTVIVHTPGLREPSTLVFDRQ